MVRVHQIEALDLPALAPYRSMRLQEVQRREGIFVAEGVKVVQRLLESPKYKIVSVLLPADWLVELRPLLERREELIEAYVAEKPVLERLTGYSMYQGVLAIGQVPTALTLPSLLARTPRPWLFVAVEGVANAQNLGVIARNCAALGGQALIAGETASSPYLRRAVRCSMGAMFNIEVLEPENLVATLQALRAAGVRSIAAHPHTQQCTLWNTDLRGDICLVFGHEDAGLSPGVLAACAETVAIPMSAGVDSLNVGSASAIFLYEAHRQRTK